MKWLKIKRVPIIIKGKVIIMMILKLKPTDWFMLKLSLKIIRLIIRAIIIKMIPPIYSHFHATRSKAIKIYVGMR